ncbi:hypothetical protein ACJW8B_15565 [Plesiomonas shigelloides]|uniref:hypothetical protein n=1 Tax=Plesiomonas shigelloides TaxID=703 RepID=UPI00387EF034
MPRYYTENFRLTTLVGFKMPAKTPSIVNTFLRSVAAKHGYQVFNDMFGTIDLTADFPITQSSGAVYGIWAKASSPLRSDLNAIPGYPEWFPIYWGKDITPVSRMKAHVQGHQNGNINLPEVKEVQGKPLIFGAILVEKYQVFETLLHDNYPPMLGSSRLGRQSTVVRIADET